MEVVYENKMCELQAVSASGFGVIWHNQLGIRTHQPVPQEKKKDEGVR
jgi:hypothetical protein